MMSIWSGIDRQAFEKELSNLSARNKIQNSRWLPPIEHNATLSAFRNLAIPSAEEKHVADGFAFLAATTNQPPDITAAALQQLTHPGHIRLVVAANQGVKGSGPSGLRAILNCLERLAARSLSAPEAELMCQDIVLDMHRDRILGRLGSAKARFQKSASINICTRLQEQLELARSATPRGKSGLLHPLQKLVSAIYAAETSKPFDKGEKTALRDVLQSSFELIYSSNILVKVLSLVRVDIKTSRVYRELRGLANYWRLCKYLVKCAKRFKASFRSIDLEILSPPPIKHSAGLLRYVHAEVQIVTYFELHPQDRPRYISSSKKPCFLCYCFIRAHATYGVYRSHGEVYEMWTVPDDYPYSNVAQKTLNKALQLTVRDIQRAASRSSRKTMNSLCLHPGQTVSKLLLDQVSSVLPSTVASREDSEQALVQAMSHMTCEEHDPFVQIPQEVDASPKDADSDAQSSVVPTSLIKTHENDSTLCTAYVYMDDVELFLEVVHDEVVRAGACAVLLARVAPLQVSAKVPKVKVEDMSCGDEFTTTSLPDVTDATETVMLLEYGLKHYIVQLRRHG